MDLSNTSAADGGRWDHGPPLWPNKRDAPDEVCDGKAAQPSQVISVLDRRRKELRVEERMDRRVGTRTPFLAIAVCVSTLATGLFAQADNPLIEAAKKGNLVATKAAIAKGGAVNERGDAGMTPLMWAALYGHTKVIDALIAAGARLNDADSEGGTALAYARAARQTEAVSLLESRGGEIRFDAMKLFIWMGSRSTEVFDYITARGKAHAAATTSQAPAASAPAELAKGLAGAWTLNLTKSEYGTFPKPTSARYVVGLDGESLTVEMNVSGAGATARYRLDGTESLNTVGPAAVKTKAKWTAEGKALAMSSLLESGGSVLGDWDEDWQLTEDQKVLRISRTVRKPAPGVITLHFEREGGR